VEIVTTFAEPKMIPIAARNGGKSLKKVYEIKKSHDFFSVIF
jgi:hypothetical protein